MAIPCLESHSSRKSYNRRFQWSAIAPINHSKRVCHDMACLENGGARCEPEMNRVPREIRDHHCLCSEIQKMWRLAHGSIPILYCIKIDPRIFIVAHTFLYRLFRNNKKCVCFALHMYIPGHRCLDLRPWLKSYT